MSRIFLYCSPSCFLRQSLSLNLKLNISPRLAALRDPLVMPGFYVGVGDRTQVPMLAKQGLQPMTQLPRPVQTFDAII